jgi:hypothetical protein
MPTRTQSTIAGLLTFFILIAVAVLLIFGQLLVLNGVSESQGFNAVSIALICQSAALFPAIILARWLPKLLITKFNWNKFLAVVVAVIAGTGVGSVLSFISIIVAIPLAGIR